MQTFTNYRGGRGLVLILAFLGVTACSSGSSGSDGQDRIPDERYTYQQPAEIGDGWGTAAASSVGVSEQVLGQLVNALQDGQFPIVDAVAVARGGQLVLSETIRTSTNKADERVDNIELDMHVQNSASKSFASALVGIALDQGLIASTDVTYTSLFPYPAYANDDPRKQAMTLEDVLTMRTGLAWNEWDPPYSEPDNQMFEFYGSQTDLSKGFLDLPMATDPGSEFGYATPASVSLGQAIENVAPLSLIDYGGVNFLLPLGISRVEVERTPTGLPDLGRGLFLTTRDLLKLGQLYLDHGEWNGERVVSADWVARSTMPHVEIGWVNPDNMEWELDGYGYQWWIGAFDLDGTRVETYAAWGFGEQWLMVVPALDLVVAVNSHGEKGDDDEANQALGLIKQILLATDRDN